MQRRNKPPSKGGTGRAGSARPAGKKRPAKPNQPRVRPRDTIRVSEEVAGHVRDGHPWIFREALKGRKLDTKNVGGIDVVDPAGRLAGRAVYDEVGAIALRVFTRREGQILDGAYVAEVVGKAASLRRRLIAEAGADGCCRVLNGDSEGLPAVNVDRYGPYLVLIGYSAVVEAYLEPLVAALQAAWQPAGVYLQRRYKPAEVGKARAGAELLAGDPAPPEVVVTEGRARYVVDVTAPLGTGLFADMRLGRREVARQAAGRRVLNCFSYAGAFTVVAALHGAAEVVSVDNAPRAHGRVRRNLSENGIDPEARTMRFVTGDVFATLARMADRGERFGMVILDPPSFSTGGGKTRPFTSLKDYASLAAAALAVLDEGPRGGVLCAGTNTARLSPADFDRALARGAAEAGRSLTVLSRVGQPADYPAAPGFPEGSYLKFVVAQTW